VLAGCRAFTSLRRFVDADGASSRPLLPPTYGDPVTEDAGGALRLALS
jgi:hypothetical protein